MKNVQTGYAEALKRTLETIPPLGSETVPLAECSDRILADERYSRVCSPSTDASLKDGYAVRSKDIEKASPQNRIPLTVIGTAAAGLPANIALSGGDAIRILTGAKIPQGADAVLSEEFATLEGDRISVFNTAEPRRNILPKGADIATGELIGSQGSLLSPGMIGLFAAAGYDMLPVYRQAKIAILATGDELVATGQPLPAGKLYASNLEMLKSWCRRYGMQTTFSILKDRPDTITTTIDEVISTHDAVLTSGGAWTGDRDFVAQTLSALGWKKYFHWVRMGPGKPVGFGMLRHKPVFLLPGGPTSNLAAFLRITLPGLLKLAGHVNASLPGTMVKLDRQLTCRQIDWTEFVFGSLTDGERHPLFTPLQISSRLKAMALAEAMITIEEGVKSLSAGDIVSAQLLR